MKKLPTLFVLCFLYACSAGQPLKTATSKEFENSAKAFVAAEFSVAQLNNYLNEDLARGKGYYHVDSNTLMTQALQEISEALKLFDIQKLRKASIMFHALATRHPENILVQENYYRSVFMRDFLVLGEPSAEANEVFETLNPLVQQTFNPPSFIHYLVLEETAEFNNQRMAALLTSIKEQPFSASLWVNLSREYEAQKLWWLAAATAQRAVELESDNPEYIYQLGDSINDIIQTSACYYDERKLALGAVKRIAKAAQVTQSQLHLDNTGLQYLRIGLFPLAYQHAKKAYEIERNVWTADHYFHSALLLNRYAEASTILQENLNYWDHPEELHAMLSVGQGARGVEANSFAHSTEFKNNVMFLARSHWVDALFSQQTEQPDFWLAETSNRWDRAVQSRLVGQIDSKEFLSLAKNGCERTEAYFYDAYYAWLQGDIGEARKQLKQVREQTATLYYEYLWAPLVLKSL